MENRHKKERKKINLLGLYALGAMFLVLMIVLMAVTANVQYKIRPESLDLLQRADLAAFKNGQYSESLDFVNELETVPLSDGGSKCLLILEEDDLQSEMARDMWIPVLSQMKVSFEVCEVSDLSKDMLNNFTEIVCAVSNYYMLSENLSALKDWTKNGGNLLIAYPPQVSGSFKNLYDIMGVKDGGEATFVEGLHFNKNYMIGGSSHDYMIIDPYDSALAYALSNDCEVYMQSTDEYAVPLIWKRKVNNGTIVVDNFSIIDKAYRGIHSSAFSLLGDYCAYPVINGAAFYIDDFPSPVPEGDSQFITRDYNLSVSDFYSQVWWNDIYDLGKKYGIRYTGVIIEDYSDQVKGEFPRTEEVTRFKYFGNMLLKAGGEIGIHGYNHMPLVLENFDYKDQYDSYIQWPSVDEMRKSLDEVFDFTSELFPDEEPKVYVPPSNVLSDEGRKLLNDTSIRAVAAVYLPVDMSFEQEFEVSDDGMINTPRITSGCVIDEYMELAALSELNFHMVNTHFHHPDDVLDEDRGAELGWATLFSNLSSYYDWLYDSCPDIRSLTGSELAAAVQRYDMLDVERKYGDGELTLQLGNFNKEAWMFLRLNNGEEIGGIEGGSYTEMADDLYLICCNEEVVKINFR